MILSNHNYSTFEVESVTFYVAIWLVITRPSQCPASGPDWTMESCGSEDSGVGRENAGLGQNIEVCHGFDEAEREEEEGEATVQFAKCRAGIQLFREPSEVSSSRPLERRPSVVRLDCPEEISHMSDLLSLMASMRMDDQRCRLGVHPKSSSETELGKKSTVFDLQDSSLVCNSPMKTFPITSGTCQEALLELKDKNRPLDQIFLLPSSQWKIHHEGSEENDDQSLRSLNTSASTYG